MTRPRFETKRSLNARSTTSTFLSPARSGPLFSVVVPYYLCWLQLCPRSFTSSPSKACYARCTLSRPRPNAPLLLLNEADAPTAAVAVSNAVKISTHTMSGISCSLSIATLFSGEIRLQRWSRNFLTGIASRDNSSFPTVHCRHHHYRQTAA